MHVHAMLAHKHTTAEAPERTQGRNAVDVNCWLAGKDASSDRVDRTACIPVALPLQAIISGVGVWRHAIPRL